MPVAEVIVDIDADLPQNAKCSGCGYLLRGLPEQVCPECGGEFDPADGSTYDTTTPGHRRRKWVVRASVLAALVAVGAVLFPRRVLVGEIAFTCQDCEHEVSVTRWELVPPAYVPLRYPGLAWTDDNAKADSDGTASARCDHDSRTVSVKYEFRGGSCSGRSVSSPGGAVYVNGLEATPRTAATVLKSGMAPSSSGLRIGGR